MTKNLKTSCNRPTAICDIEIRNGLLKEKEALVRYFASLAGRFVIITDDNLVPLYGKQLQRSLSDAGLEAYLFSFPNGEQSKTRQMKERLEDRMFAKGLGRDTCLIALGGGVVTDLGGYLAATYCRGIPLVMIPTSLLGMVDASIGGKTGVNIPQGKNLIGCVYQSKKIMIDPGTINSLPIAELRNGVVEMIKHGLIADRTYFDYLEKHVQDLLALDPFVLEKAIYDSCRIKSTIVEEDENENGKRRLLNFGHTIGHALENLTQYSIAHGHAVAIGILVESHIAVQMNQLAQSDFNKIQRIFEAYGVPINLPVRFPVPKILEAMILDKKSLKGRARFVILQEIGKANPFDAAYCSYVDDDVLKNALLWMNNALCSH